ncbi:MAG: hypothetical protein EOP04_07515 [Proteobacteria bacterium]|nr:MAG: hypothetical protein EOP04_07515 [Pseudomonadota bacterium]
MKFEDGKYVLVLDDFEEECDIAAASIQLPCMWVSHPGKVLRNPKAFKPMAILLDQDFGPGSEKTGSSQRGRPQIEGFGCKRGFTAG